MLEKKLSSEKFEESKPLNYKHRILAVYQFFSNLAIALFLACMIFIGYSIIKSDPTIHLNVTRNWKSGFEEAATFSGNEFVGILRGITLYLSISLWVICIIIGLFLFKFENRNLFDSLFIIFLVIPIMSNVFCLFAQLATRKLEYTKSHFDKEKIIQEETRIIKMNLKSIKKEENKRIKDTEVDKSIIDKINKRNEDSRFNEDIKHQKSIDKKRRKEKSQKNLNKNK